MLREHVFSTQFILRSLHGEETQDVFYARVRRWLYEYISRRFPLEDTEKARNSEIVPCDPFVKLGVSCRIYRLQGSFVTSETELAGGRVFLLCTSEPRKNKRYREASDHSYCVETIIQTFQDLFEHVSVRVSVRSWVEYQPFAGFTKTRKLPRLAPSVVEWMACMADAEMLFAPRWVSKEERSNDPELQDYCPLYYPIYKEYKIVSDDKTLRDFNGHLTDPFRPIPIVVFFGDSRRHLTEARELAKRCWIKCRVWVLRKNTENLAEVLEGAIPGIDVRWNFRWGVCRIFFPRGLYRQDDAAQPWRWVPFLWKRKFRKRMAIGLLRFYLLDASGGWITSGKDLLFAKYESLASKEIMESDKNARMMNAIVKQMIAERNRARYSRDVVEKDLERAIRDVDVIKEENAKIQESSNDLLNESTEAVEERDRLLAENGRLMVEIQRLQGMKSEWGERSISQDATLPFAIDDAPSQFETLVWVTSRLFKGLAFVPGAWDNMRRKGNNKRFVVEVWRMLWSLEHFLLPKLVNPLEGNPAMKFQEQTGYEYSPKDSSDLPPEMDSKRDVTFENRKWRIEHHIGNGNRDATLIRIYFAVDRESNRLIVGSIGDHLPNLGTAKNS